MRFRFTERGSLLDLADYLEEAKIKPLAERKTLWWSLIAKEGVQMAVEIGESLNVEESIISEWIRDWIKTRQRPLGEGIPASHPMNSVAVNEVSLAELSSGEKNRLRI